MQDGVLTADREYPTPKKEAQVNENILKGKWHQLKGEAKTRWGKLTDDDIDQVDGQAQTLVGKLQERYGYAQEQAEAELSKFLSGHQ